MNLNLYFLFVNLLLFSFCLCELSVGKKEKLLNGFIEYYNNLPDRVYTCQEGFLQNTQQVNDTTYQIVVNLKVTEITNVDIIKTLQCTASVQDLETGVSVTGNVCQEAGDMSPEASQAQTPQAQVEVTEPTIERQPVKLDNEVQDPAITSGEQFIAVPRDQPSAPCVGCASYVNPQAAGVADLANLGVRHLDIHEPSVKHSLDTVLDVERQVQVVNGVRYVLTLSIHFNKCSEQESEDCALSKICKVTILVKPWKKLPNGGNYRAILANNCTEEWQYGDNGEVVPELPTTADHGDNNGSDDDIQVKHNTDIDAQPNQEKTLTEEDLKNIQDQIIPNSQFQKITEPDQESIPFPDTSGLSKQHVFKVDSGKNSKNSIPETVSTNTAKPPININTDKKKAIDDLLAYFDFSGLKPKTESDEAIPRVRRSYDYDLQVLSLAEDYHGIKKSIENARFMYDMAQAMVDYLNEMDMEIKNRAVKDVVRAEEEIDSLQRFVYVQARVIIPCDKVECEPRDEVIQICNGVIDGTNENSPQILNTFCYNDYKERNYRDVIKEISLDDPVLQRLATEAMKIIETESTSKYAIKLNKIVSANTQVTSGTLTKFSIIIDYIKCNKSVPLLLRVNCTVLENLGSKICEVIYHERHWLKERKISYTCTDRPVDMRISKSKSIIKNITVDDPKVTEMLQEAVQYLETQSNKNNKQKIVNIKSISSQIVAGFLIKIEFVVGYTNCTDEMYPKDEISKCELMTSEGLRLCKAQIWDRSWIIDGRQLEVSCDDIAKINETENMRKKRSIDIESQVQQSVNDSNLEYLTLANESLKKFLQSTSSVQHYEVVKVYTATIQDVAGKLIRMEFTISPTNCHIKKDGVLSSPKCHIVNSNNLYRCRSKILENVWLDKKQYFVNCNTKEQEQQIKTHSNELKERNPSDLKYLQLAEESMKKYLHDTGISVYHRIVRVQRVTTQIVSGLLTSIDFIISPNKETDGDNNTIRCLSKILEKHWLGTKDLNVSCQMQRNSIISDFIDTKPDSPKYMQIAVESLQKFIKTKPDSHLVRVTFVDKVIQEGEMIKIRFLASHSEDDDGDTLCHAEYTEQGLLRSDIEVKCHLIGAVLRKTKVTEDDPKYFQYVHLADESLHNYLQRINSSNLYTIINIENITVQWEDGIKTLIHFIAAPIDLENSEMQGKRCLSQITEQPWLHNKNIDIKCETDKDLYRTKRQTLGARRERDPTNPKYKKLAEESLQKYVKDSGITQSLELERVVGVTTQVVSGTLTRIDFVVSNKQDSKASQCHSEIWEQSWLNFKEIKVSCQNDDRRPKRASGVPGGSVEQDPSDPTYKKLAEESLQKYVKDSGITQSLELVQVVGVTTQVVAGKLTKIHFVVSNKQDSTASQCNSEIWEQSWRNFKEIKVSCQNDDRRAKRASGVPGGSVEQDPSDPTYKKLAEESLQKYVKDSGITQSLELVQVVGVTTQVVAGKLTKIHFVVSNKQDSTASQCNSEIWEQSWRNFKEIKVSCQNDDRRAKRASGVPGGSVEQDPSDPTYKKLAEESLQKYVKDSGITQSLELVQVVGVTTQVVAGKLTKIDFVVSNKQDSKASQCHSEIWEQSWRNFKEIKVSCQNDDRRAKRASGVPGGSVEQDPSDPTYKKLAEESLQKYVKDSGITQSLELLRVVGVTTQVVAGTLTKIHFVVSNKQDSTSSQCHSEIWEQPWRNFKEIKVSCQNYDRRAKRASGVPGGSVERDPSDPTYQKLAEESLQKYVKDAGITQSFELLRVVGVTTQVVAGTLTKIHFVVSNKQDSTSSQCHSEIWEQPWRNFKEIKVSCQNYDRRAKRASGVPGGSEERDPSDPTYQKLAEESLQKYVKDSGITQSFELVRVVGVTTQVVAGTLTKIHFVVSNKQDSTSSQCHSEIWEQPWRNFKEIKVSCQNYDRRAKRASGVPGGSEERDPSDPTYQKLAEESLQKYVKDSGITQSFELVRVVGVTTQVVAGTLTKIHFVVSNKQDSTSSQCHSEIWEQPWRNFKEIKVSCQNYDRRAKRASGVPGGSEERDPSDPTYQKLAEESLQKYVKDAGITQSFELLRVVGVTTQVVAGTLTKIHFVVSNKQDSTSSQCHSEIWEQPWRNFKEIKVSCQNDDRRAKRASGVPGGSVERDPSDPTYQKLAEESLQKYVKDAGITQSFELLRVVGVTTQVVAGTLTKIHFVVSNKQDSTSSQCHSEIWEQPWRNFKEIKVSCQNDDRRAKRASGVPGGSVERDPSDPTYQKLAEESLQKYVKDAGITQSFELVRVVGVTTQVVAGTLTKIHFVVSNKQDSTSSQCHSEIWEQPWRNFKEIKVSCQNYDRRAKRASGVPGGSEERDPSDPTYQKLAEESLQKYVKDAGITQSFELLRVVGVTTQVVAGTLTKIHFVVSNKQDSTSSQCHSEIWEQPWRNFKEIKVSCQNDDRRAKRASGVPGGSVEQDPSDPTYQKLAEESLQKYVKDAGITQSFELLRVVGVTTQVVAGTLTKIHFVVSNKQDSTSSQCHSEIWEQPWRNFKEIKVSCQNDDRRAKRASSVPGGSVERDPSDPTYQKLAEESLQKYVKDAGITQSFELLRVVGVTTQVVAGTLTKIHFVVSNKQDSTSSQCHSEIWEQPWRNFKEIKVSCQNDDRRAKRASGVPGGSVEQDPSDPTYQKLAEESLQKYVKDAGITQSFELLRVVGVTTQVVAGTLTKIHFVVSNKQDSTSSQCHSEIWEQPWRNFKEIKVSCQNDDRRAKRASGVPGGSVEQDPSDPTYQKLAEESLQKYVKDAGITQSFELLRVVGVTTQVVAGTLTKIHFVVSNKQDSTSSQCHSEIWEQPWRNFKEIKVSCQNDDRRAKRASGVPGGSVEQDPSDPTYQKLAEESLQKYLTNSGNQNPYKLFNVLKVTSQMVAGSKILIDFTVAPTNNLSSLIYCHSNIWEQKWLNKTEIDVNCDIKNVTSRKKRELSQRITKKNDQFLVSNLQGQTKKEQDPNQFKYKLLAQESLRKYQQKSKMYHKVIEVKRVLKPVVSGFKYEIDFSAAPTVCPVNVSKVDAEYCKKIDDVVLYCHSEIWDQPWLKQKKINVKCYGPEDNDFEDYESDDSEDFEFTSSNLKNSNERKYKLLAEEASEKYLSTSKRRYVHKVTKIHSVSENIADGTITKIEYSLSPTMCLRNETSSFNDTCKFKRPIIVFHCNAKIWDRPWMHLEKDIKVTCKKESNHKSLKHKRDLGVRTVRQIGDDDDEIDEDTVYYYADRAVQHVNDQSQSNNLHKLITIHAVQNSMQMGTVTIKMYIEIAETFCLRHHRDMNLHDCEEMDGLNHRLCFVRLWPSPDDELIVRHVSVVCDDDQDFQSVSGVNIPELVKMSILDLERSPDVAHKLVHQGEPQIIPSLDSRVPFKINFIVGTTNCSKDVNLHDNPFQCYINTAIPSKSCHSFIWLKAETRFIRYINSKCTPLSRSRRSLTDPTNTALDNLEIQKMVSASLEKLEMSSLHRYKQRVLQINSHSTKITSGKVTTIDFDVGYTSCLKYEWVENITSCDFLEHLPRRRCVAQIWERLWIKNGKNIDVNCVDDETPLESHIEFESAEMANELAREALKHIEAKYPHPNKQKVVRIFSLEKQVIAGIHYRLKIEVGLTDCVALSEENDCKFIKNLGLNKFCRVNVWVRPWTDHPPNFRVSCDFHEGTSHDFYHHVQAEHLFYNFLTTYNPSYVNDYSQMQKRFEIFKTNIKKIHEFNVYEKGTATYGVTRFTDLTYEEFSSTYMGLNKNLRDTNQIPMKKADVPDIKIPQNFDWREYDAVTEVKDQGSCGSCWAFSVTGNIEGQWKMQSGQLVSLSEQELVDCDKLDQGCNGGLPDNAYRAIEQMGGLELEIDYPYEAVDDKCVFNKTLAKVQISGAVNITTNETGMAQWLVHNGPISIGINANAMQFYMGGISHPWKMLCNPTNLDHGVLIVGYGIKDYPLFHKQLPYWIVKNSWGKSWGEQGYYRVYRGDGTCGVNQMASSAVI